MTDTRPAVDDVGLTKRRPGPTRRPHYIAAVGVLLLIAGLVAFALYTVNIDSNPDIVWDEVVYSEAGGNVIAENRLAWDEAPIAVHPPLFFLLLSGWIEARGVDGMSGVDQILWTRHLTNITSAVMVMLVGGLVIALLRRRSLAWQLYLAAVAMLIVGLDPIAQRYGRLTYIDTLAITFGLAVVVASVVIRERLRRATYVLIVGGLAGLALLSKEIAIVFVAAPLVGSLLVRDRSKLEVYPSAVGDGFTVVPARSSTREDAAVVGVGMMVWALFPLWAAITGSFSQYADEKLITLRRLAGLLQTSGWNREGVSSLDILREQASRYGATYVLLAIGAVATIWFLVRAIRVRQDGIIAGLLTLTFGLVGYSFVFGQANEQFFLYAVVSAGVGSVLLLDRLASTVGWEATDSSMPRKSRGIGLGGVVVLVAALLATALLATSSWMTRYWQSDDAALVQMISYIETEVPACSVVNTSGDVFKYRGLLGPHKVTDFSNGPDALAYGVHYFLVSDVDAERLYGNMTPEFAAWIQQSGMLLTEFSGDTYGRLGLYSAPPAWNAPETEIVATDASLFTNAVGSACGGFPIQIVAGGDAVASYGQLGGKSTLGRAQSAPFALGGSLHQLFDSALVRVEQTGPRLAPLVDLVQKASPAELSSLGIVVDVSDASELIGAVDSMWGSAVGPVVAAEGGKTIQAFENGVLSRTASGLIEPIPIADAAIAAGLVPDEARTLQPVPDLFEDVPDEPAPASVFVALLFGAAALFGVAAVAVRLSR